MTKGKFIAFTLDKHESVGVPYKTPKQKQQLSVKSLFLFEKSKWYSNCSS